MDCEVKRAPGYTTSEPIDDPAWRSLAVHFEHSGTLHSRSAREFEISCAALPTSPGATVGLLAMSFEAGPGRMLSVHVAVSADTLREYAASMLRCAAQVDDGAGLQ